MSNIPTAEEFLEEESGRWPRTKNVICSIMKEFAKLHVEAALKAAANNVSEGPADAMEACIIESYPLTNIK